MARSASTLSIPWRLRMAISVSPDRTVMREAAGGRTSVVRGAAAAGRGGSSADGAGFATGTGPDEARSTSATLATARGRVGRGSFVMRLENRPFSPRSTSMRRPCGSSISSHAMRGSKPGTGRFATRTVMPAGRRRGLNTRRKLCTRASASGLRTSASRSRSIRVRPERRVRESSKSAGSTVCCGPS